MSNPDLCKILFFKPPRPKEHCKNRPKKSGELNSTSISKIDQRPGWPAPPFPQFSFLFSDILSTITLQQCTPGWHTDMGESDYMHQGRATTAVPLATLIATEGKGCTNDSS